MKLENSSILITGASKGLGKAIALDLSRKGANLILVARSQQLLETVRQEIHMATGKSPMIITCDIASEEQVKNMALTVKNALGRVDALINNAGIGYYLRSEALPNQLMRAQFETNFFGAFYCIKALLPLLKKSGNGYILNVGSLFSFVALADNGIYAATKFALAGFTTSLRQELKPHQIRVGLFAPGAIDTSFQDQKGENATKTPKALLMEPQTAATIVGKMIQKQQNQRIFPRWQLPLLRIKQLLA